MNGLDVERAIKFILRDPKWLRKLGLFIGVQVVVGLVSTVLQFLPNLGTGLLDSTSKGSQATGALLTIVPMLILVGLAICMIPLFIYLTGYTFKVTKNVMNGVENPLPDHDDIMGTFKLVLALFIIGLGPMFAMILSMGVGIGVIVGLIALIKVASESSAGAIAAILIVVVAVLVGLLLFITISAIALIVVPSMQYIYLKSGSIAEAYNLGRIRAVAKASWLKLLLVMALSIAFSFVAGIVGMLSWFCLLGWLVQPLSQLWLTFLQAHLVGQVYKELHRANL